MFYKKLSGLVAVLLMVAASVFARGPKPDAQSVGDGLLCQCGCNIQVSKHCQHGECPSHAEMRALIQKDISGGMDEAAIRNDFVSRYGTKVLATPEPTGFNLSVWILPGLGFIGGLGAVVVFVRRWRSPSREIVRAPSAPIDPKIMAAMEEEMKRVAG